MKNASTFKTHGVCCISNYGGYEIEISANGEAARVRLNDGDHVTCPRWQEIKYDKAGNQFVTFHGRKLMLENFMRVN